MMWQFPFYWPEAYLPLQNPFRGACYGSGFRVLFSNYPRGSSKNEVPRGCAIVVLVQVLGKSWLLNTGPKS